MDWSKMGIYQIKLPAPTDTDPHPRLLINGWGLHAGDCYPALMPDGEWHDVTFEVDWNTTGPECWYISNKKFQNISPLGLFVKTRRY